MGPDMKCTCLTDPYNCPQGKALVAAILKRKKYAALDAISELGSDETPLRKLGK